MRKLSESGTLTDIHNNLLQQLGEKQDGNNIFEENKDDISSEYQSMNVAFSSCYFKVNNITVDCSQKSNLLCDLTLDP